MPLSLLIHLHVLHLPVALGSHYLLGWKGHTHLTDVKAETQDDSAIRPVSAASCHGLCCETGLLLGGVIFPRCPALSFLTPQSVAVPEALCDLVVVWACGRFSLLMVLSPWLPGPCSFPPAWGPLYWAPLSSPLPLFRVTQGNFCHHKDVVAAVTY